MQTSHALSVTKWYWTTSVHCWVFTNNRRGHHSLLAVRNGSSICAHVKEGSVVWCFLHVRCSQSTLREPTCQELYVQTL